MSLMSLTLEEEEEEESMDKVIDSWASIYEVMKNRSRVHHRAPSSCSIVYSHQHQL